MPTSDSGIDTIEEVLEALDTIIAQTLEEGSRVGYFAAVYRVVTAKIAEGIATGFFDDGERMQRLDVTFADRIAPPPRSRRHLDSIQRMFATLGSPTAGRLGPMPVSKEGDVCRARPFVERRHGPWRRSAFQCAITSRSTKA